MIYQKKILKTKGFNQYFTLSLKQRILFEIELVNTWGENQMFDFESTEV